MCSRRATALIQIFGLDRLDTDDVGKRKILPPPADWVEQEERRRTFWAAFSSDRFASAGNGWSTGIDETQVIIVLYFLFMAHPLRYLQIFRLLIKPSRRG